MAPMGWQIDDAARLQTLSECGILDTPQDTVFDEITATAARVCAAPVAIINIVAQDRQFFKSRFGTDLAEPALKDSLCVHTLEHGDQLVICDLSDDRRTEALPVVADEKGLRFYAAAPIVVRGQGLGTLSVLDWAVRPEGLTPEQSSGLTALSNKLARLIEAR